MRQVGAYDFQPYLTTPSEPPRIKLNTGWLDMTSLCLRLSFSFIAVSLITLSGLAQQPPSVTQTASSTAAQKKPSVQKKEAPVTQQNRAVAPSRAPNQQGENSVISQPDHRVNLHPPEIMAGAGYSHFWGPAVLPFYYPYGWGLSYAGLWGPYSPWWSDPWRYPYGYYSAADGRGEIRFQVEPKTAEVLIDGGYAGTVASLKSSLWLDPGAYNLCVKAAGLRDYCRRVYVLSGKKLQVLARLSPAAGEVNP
jgi:hypothetical protein